jgi:prefoldin subunit 4
MSWRLISGVRYKVGETFLHLPLPRVLRRLEKDLAAVTSKITSLSDSADDCVTKMNGLKAMLYAKFGRAINLDE